MDLCLGNPVLGRRDRGFAFLDRRRLFGYLVLALVECCLALVELGDSSLGRLCCAGEARAATVEENQGVFTGIFTGSPEADQTIRDAHVVPSGNEAFDQVIQTYYEVVEYGQSFGASPVGQEITNELTNAMTAALLGDKTAEQALADAQATVIRAYENVTD